jgi:Acyl-CoA carboxylase epsilon subunit
VSDDDRTDPPPVLRVVRGRPTAEELAALVTVLAARSAAPAPRGRRRVSHWSDPRRVMRRSTPPAPGGWRSSGLPG